MAAGITRREFATGGGAALALFRGIQLPVPQPAGRPVRIAVISDLHHGLAPDALSRFNRFLEEVAERRDLDAVFQLGDFCYSDAGAEECLERWRSLGLPRFNVLGNHDMDRVDKATAMAAWGMPSRHYAVVLGGWRFVVLDLNHLRKDGELQPYANGNYFTPGLTHNWADPAQLAWLGTELRQSAEPVVLVAHQPIGLGSRTDPLPDEQREILEIVAAAARDNPRGRVACCLSGHLHVDRLEWIGAMPCLCVNSASYFWSDGMHTYSEALFAFMEFGADGVLRIEGRHSSFEVAPPAASDGVAGRSASIQDRTLRLS